MNSKYILMIFIALLLGFTSCTERIDIKVDDSFERLVVEAEITTEADYHKVILSKTSDYFEGTEQTMVSEAIVIISDDNGNDIQFIEDQNELGHYVPTNKFMAVPGVEYNLNINLKEDIGGFNEFESTSKVPFIGVIDSINFDYFPGSPITLVRLYANDPVTQEYYTFSLYRNGNLITDSIAELNFSEDRIFNGGNTNGIGVGFFNEFKPDELLAIGDTVTVRMASVDHAYFEFLSGLQQEIGFSLPLFSGPPANIKGNISNGAIGFFAAYTTTYESAVFVGF